MVSWTAADVPDQSGRTIVVTGGNSGIGAHAASVLAASGASVVLACRDLDRGRAAAATMSGDVSVRQLDLADLASVRAFADGTDGIDVLLNNAGVMAVPHRRTVDGFEMQIGTNFLGPYALTALLLPKVRDRVVTLTSVLHWAGRIDLDDLDWRRRRYHRWLAYCQSKLADLMWSYELARRLADAGSVVRSIAAHPGFASTELISHTESVQGALLALATRLVAQDGRSGALPGLYAATMPDAETGELYGPDGIGELRGSPRRVGSSRPSRDTAVAARLWDVASELTGVSFDLS